MENVKNKLPPGVPNTLLFDYMNKCKYINGLYKQI
jgi:hypothetical protein